VSELTITLTQIEKSDIGPIKTILESGFEKFIIEKNLTSKKLDKWFEEHNRNKENFSFGIRARKDNDHRSFLVGMCGIWNIDWVARHGKLFFIMVDRDSHQATMQNYPATRAAVEQLLAFAFDDINLDKVWIEVLEQNDIKDALEHFGFVAEGIRKATLFRGGEYLNSIVCSITYEEYCDKVAR
jgi:RimJ/RimL family protein N-acetyltransferase